MRFITISIFAVAGRLVALAIAKPIVPNSKPGGIAIPLTRHPSSLDSSNDLDLDAITSHGLAVREKILNGLDNYKMNTGKEHPFAVKRSKSRLERRGVSLPLTPTAQNKGWMCEISIGTPARTFNVHIDTGSADMWMLQDGCDGIQSEGRDLWDPFLSDTSEYEAGPFRLTYGDGTTVNGDRYADNVTLAGFRTEYQTFGSVSSYTGPVQNNGNSDGLLGLAFPAVSSIGVDPLFESLVRESTLISPTFSLKLTPSGSEMYVGGANSMLYRGNIAYTRVVNTGLWQVSMDDIRVNGHKVLENIPAIFDTGASYIFGDRQRVSELYNGLGATVHVHGNFEYYSIPCDSFPAVTFTFGTTSFEIPPEALKLPVMLQGSSECFSSIVAERSASTGLWTIGTAFMRGVYTVFDYGTLQIGFAQLA